MVSVFPQRVCFSLFLILFFCLFLLRWLRAPWNPYSLGSFSVAGNFFFHYQMILLPDCLMYSILSNSAAQKKDVPLCTLERYNSMMSIAVVSTTSAEVSPDPNEQDAYVCTSFFQSFLKQAQMIVSSYYLN